MFQSEFFFYIQYRFVCETPQALKNMKGRFAADSIKKETIRFVIKQMSVFCLRTTTIGKVVVDKLSENN